MKSRKDNPRYSLRFYHRPGLSMSDAERGELVSGLREVAATCFDSIPEYQSLVGTREALSDKVITAAFRPDGTMAGFCSALLMEVEGVGTVLHLGLTCVHVNDRGTSLTHQLTSKLVIGYMLRKRPVGRLWVTNVACVLSSLGNVALNFEDVYPSPFYFGRPTDAHLAIARTISRRYRKDIHISESAALDERNFVFRRSVENSVFQKDSGDRRYHHRNEILNQYYQHILQFGEGDEIVQVGHVSSLSAVMYMARKLAGRKRPVNLPPLQPAPSPQDAG
ncbi:MAG: hypothetical protein GMKNLPBB_01792 [Myxococcota bacterium]|nr:hypothetical protein [Myxococcota bacterium]